VSPYIYLHDGQYTNLHLWKPCGRLVFTLNLRIRNVIRPSTLVLVNIVCNISCFICHDLKIKFLLNYLCCMRSQRLHVAVKSKQTNE